MSFITMKDLELDSKYINDFREEVNKNKQFIYLCENIDNSNQMNAIYSAMDWICVGVEGTSNMDIKLKGIGYNHKNSIALLQYIIVIDQIVDSVKLLHKVLEAINVGSTQISYPYKKSDDIFSKPVSDDVFFKHIRAVFGMHSIDLNAGIDGERQKGGKFYASWPAFGMPGEDDFVVQIYNNSPGYEPSEVLGISLENLNIFVRERYDTLVTLTQKVSEVTYTLEASYKGVSITLKNDDLVEDVQVLLQENNKRFGVLNGGYEFLLLYFKEMFSVAADAKKYDFGGNILEAYNEHLKKIFNEIKNNLENMNREITRIGIRARGYEFEKITQYLDGSDKYIIGEEYFEGLVKHSILPGELIMEKDLSIKRYVLDAFLFSKMENKNEILFVDLLNDPSVYRSNGISDFTGYFI